MLFLCAGEAVSFSLAPVFRGNIVMIEIIDFHAAFTAFHGGAPVSVVCSPYYRYIR